MGKKRVKKDCFFLGGGSGQDSREESLQPRPGLENKGKLLGETFPGLALKPFTSIRPRVVPIPMKPF